MELYFDNSVLSRIAEHPDRDAIVVGLRLIGRIRVTSANVLEAANRNEKLARDAKLEFYRELTGEIRPADPPNEVLMRSATAYKEGNATLDLGSAEAWHLLHDPDFITDDVQDESFAWTREREEEFRSMHRDGRSIFNELFNRHPNFRPSSARKLITHYCDTIEDLFDPLFIPAFERATGESCSYEVMRRFMNECEPWRMYWAGRAHGMYTRSMQASGYGAGNAGLTDIEQSIYLAFADRFYTFDRAQFDALSDVATFAHRHVEVVWWDDVARSFGL